MSDDVVDFLLGAAGAPARFDIIGATCAGKVVAHEKRQSKDMDGNLKFWEDGAPVYEVVITMQTDYRDASIEDDDGLRRVFVRGQMLKAVRDALVKASWRSSLVGGTLGIRYVKDGEAKRSGFSPPKLYAAKFEPPTPADDFDQPSEEDLSQYSEAPF